MFSIKINHLVLLMILEGKCSLQFSAISSLGHETYVDCAVVVVISTLIPDDRPENDTNYHQQIRRWATEPHLSPTSDLPSTVGFIENVRSLPFNKASVCNGDRRIVRGEQVTVSKKYVVYLIKAKVDVQLYDAWLCGGALVSSTFVITSAACVEDVKHLYVVAGYEKYIPNDMVEKNDCIRKTKKRVIYTCVPKSYQLDYARLDRWAHIDIALVKVESGYSRHDVKVDTCSYIPEPIPINYEPKYQEPGTDAVVLGWGHSVLWRRPNDTRNLNSANLRFGSTLIQDKKECKRHYTSYSNMSFVIDNYMICTFLEGNLNDKGELKMHSSRNVTGCSPSNKGGKHSYDDQTPDGFALGSCEEISQEIDEADGFFNNDDNTRRQEDFEPQGPPPGKSPPFSSGICQNDHGGPLVTWVGSHEVLIGVASVFKVDEHYRCMAPYLYTSTQCNGAFLSCILESNNITQKHSRTGQFRRELCDSPPEEKGYDTIERHISWLNHPDGPAENEKLLMRPQRPLRGQ